MTYKITVNGVQRDCTPEEIEQIEKDRLAANDFRLKLDIDFARQNRNQKLLESDWVELPSAALRLTPEQISSWLVYRQELRDITTQSGFPQQVTWPQAPQ